MLFGYGPWSLLIVVQIVCAVHAARNDRQGWIWPIIVFPAVGCIAYVATQVRFSTRSRGLAGTAARGVVTALAPTRRLRQLRDAVDHCDTIENRLALATECTALGRHDEALSLYESCRTGAFRDDPVVLQGLARSYFERGARDQARAVLDELFTVAPREATPATRVLHGRVLEATGDPERALATYADAALKGTGDEARCRRAVLLDSLGRSDEARAIFERIRKDAARTSRAYRRDNHEWLAIAHERLARQ